MLKRILWLRNRYQSCRATLLSSVSHDTSSGANFLKASISTASKQVIMAAVLWKVIFYSLRLSSSALRVLLPA